MTQAGRSPKSDPLYCLVIFAKRYVLFNIIDNQTVIRKISGHGLGALRHLDDYDPSLHELTAPEHIAAPVNDIGQRNYGDLVHGPTPRMLCDIWRIAIDCFRNRTQNKIDDIISALPQLQVPQYTHFALSSAHLMSLYPNLPARRGFQFFATFPAPRCAVSSGVAGTMAANGSGAQMSTLRSLALAWVLTLPCAIGLSAFLFFVFSHLF